MLVAVAVVAICTAIVVSPSDVQAQSVDDDTVQIHQQAMDLAGGGVFGHALQLLEKALARYPNHFPFQRDYIVVAGEAKDCVRVHTQYEKLTSRQQLYPDIVVPVARCIREQNRVRAAIALLEKSATHYPEDQVLHDELVEARAELKDQAITAETGLETESSEPGTQEWRLEGTVYGEVADRLHAYSRILIIRADDPGFATAEVNRAFGGLEHVFGKTSVTGELSTDIVRPDETGIAGIVRHHPNERWVLELGYYTFSENIPLRAKALDIGGDQWHASLDYHSNDYVWEWTAAADAYAYTDSNQRREWYSELGYGFDLQKDHEQRAVLEVSQSSNTLSGTVYYNPLSAMTVIGGYKYTWVMKSRFKRHVDELYLWAGNYEEQGFGINPIYGLRYQQDYDFDSVSSLLWNISWSSKVYDGNRESGLSAGIRYKRVLK